MKKFRVRWIDCNEVKEKIVEVSDWCQAWNCVSCGNISCCSTWNLVSIELLPTQVQ